MEILVNRSRLPRAMPILLAVDDGNRTFSPSDLQPATSSITQGEADILFLERTRIEATLGGCRGVLTVEKGSRFSGSPTTRIGNISVQGGEVILRDNKHFVEIREDVAIIRMEKQPNQQYFLALHSIVPAEAKDGDSFEISVEQRDEQGQTVGGSTAVYVVKSGLSSDYASSVA